MDRQRGAGRERGMEKTDQTETTAKGFRIKLSTMEMILIATLLGSLVLGLWQARQEERHHASASRDSH
jgi:hypothetical protein